MARKNSFDMNTLIQVTDLAAGALLVNKLKAVHHKDLLAIAIEASPEGPITCTQLVEALDSAEYTEEQARIWKKYSKAAHVQYLINRCRGVITATKATGEVIVPTTTAGTTPKVAKKDQPTLETTEGVKASKEVVEQEAAAVASVEQALELATA